MIAVSVARSVRGPGTDPDVIRRAASGHWPYRNETDRDRLLEAAPAWALPLVGTPAPTELTFGRGERWRVKLFPTQEIRDRLESRDQSLTLRGHHLRITATGDLIVRPAPGRSVTVTC